MPDTWRSPSVSTEKLEAIIKRELPGFAFRLNHRADTFVVEMEVARRIEGKRYALTDDMAMGDPESPNNATAHVIDQLRNQAVIDYGLTAYVESEMQRAAQLAHAAALTALLAELETFRPSIPTIQTITEYEDDDSYDSYQREVTVWVPGDLPPQIAQVFAWAKTHQRHPVTYRENNQP